MNRTLLGILRFGFGVLTLAGITHLLSILLMPHLAARNPAARLLATHDANAPVLLPEETPADASLPFADPALTTAICPFDVADGPVRLRLRSGEHFMSLVFLSPEGRVSYALTDKAAIRRLIDIRILTETQLRQLEAQDPDDEPVQELRIRVKETRGVVLVRVFNPSASTKDASRALLQRMVCGADSPS
jgi:uncharacterized membrane protein